MAIRNVAALGRGCDRPVLLSLRTSHELVVLDHLQIHEPRLYGGSPHSKRDCRRPDAPLDGRAPCSTPGLVDGTAATAPLWPCVSRQAGTELFE
jgi:hypothetical protein